MRVHVIAVSVIALLVPTLCLSAEEARGVIIKLDTGKQELTLEARGKLRGAITFVLDKETPVLFGKQAGSLADLAVGKRVRVSFDFREGKPVATAIVSLSGGKPAAPAVPAAPAGNTITGRLARVGLTMREIVVVSPGQKGETEWTLPVPVKAKITKADKTITLDGLKEGETVTVQFEMRDNKRVAAAIAVGDVALPQSQSKFAKIRSILQRVDQLLELAEKMNVIKQ